MIATWEPQPNLEPRLPMCASPRLPPFAAPRPLVLPACDVLGADGLSAGEPSCDFLSDEGSMVEERPNAEGGGLLHADEHHLPASQSFQRLLRDLAAEHQRALVQLRAKLEGPASPRGSIASCSSGQSEQGQPPRSRRGSTEGRRSSGRSERGQVGRPRQQLAGPPQTAADEGLGAPEVEAEAQEAGEGPVAGNGAGSGKGTAEAAPASPEAPAPRASIGSGTSWWRARELEARAREPEGAREAPEAAGRESAGAPVALASLASGESPRFSVWSSASRVKSQSSRLRKRCALCESTWRLLDDPESSRAAHCYMVCMMAFTLASVAVALLQTVDPPILEKRAAAVVEVSIEGVFLLELSLRFFVCPNYLRFALDWHNFVDLLAVLPLALRASFDFELPAGQGDNVRDLGRNALLGLVPVFRLLKTVRRFERFRLLIHALQSCAEALPICLFPLMMITASFGALIFMVEPRDNIGSLGTAMWLTIVTMTTVGYGDVSPVTPAGSCIVSVLVITSVMYMAMPLGIIGQAFQQAWAERDKVLLVARTKHRLTQWAYHAEDIPVLFEWFDRDRDGSLNEREFLTMIGEMRLGLSKQRALDLFKSFDEDSSGTVSDKEFVRALFPESYSKIYVGPSD